MTNNKKACRATSDIKALDSSRQIAFHTLLVDARTRWLKDALAAALLKADQHLVKEQILRFVPSDVQRLLAQAGIRDEHVFPTPAILEVTPSLIGYYRLLLGVPQKSFYSSGSGLSALKPAEMKGLPLVEQQRALLDRFCQVMADALAQLIRGMTSSVTPRDVEELPLLILGSQFQGGKNNIIGNLIAAKVFKSISYALTEIGFEIKETAKRITVNIDENIKFLISVSSDPDVKIEKLLNDARVNMVAIEIKGGSDRSNAHNRAGEIEKSHLKAKERGFANRWALMHTKGVKMSKIQSASPSTTAWFDVAQVVAREGSDWTEFLSRLTGMIHKQ